MPVVALFLMLSASLLFQHPVKAADFHLSQAQIQNIIDEQALLAFRKNSAIEQSSSESAGYLKFKPLIRETRNLSFMSLGAMLVILALPEDVSNWDRSKIKPKKLANNWQENVQDGPVWDKDRWQINYLGHPYFGSVYYVLARNHGLNKLESFSYSFLMSAFLWEYGFESFAEVPSIQDLIVTPVIGSILGEGFYIWEQRLLDNQGELWGSSGLGAVALFLLNPAGCLSHAINQFLGIGKQDIIQSTQSNWVIQPAQAAQPGKIEQPGWLGLQVRLKF